MDGILWKAAESLSAAGFIAVTTRPSHVRLTARAVEILFGKGARLTPAQPEKAWGSPFPCEETVHLIGPLGKLCHLPVEGPPVPENQVFLSLAEAERLGLSLPLRRGEGESPRGILEGPYGSLEGVPVGLQRRRLSLSPARLEVLSLRAGDTVDVEVFGGRPLILREVEVEEADRGPYRLVLDPDEARAAGIGKTALGRIRK